MRFLRLIQAFTVLLVVDLLMRLGTRYLYFVFRMLSRAHVPWAASSLEPSIIAVNEASVWYFHRVQCLQRASALWLMSHIRGVKVDLVIGYRPVPFQSHAWIEQNGAVINERPQYQRHFAVLDRL